MYFNAWIGWLLDRWSEALLCSPMEAGSVGGHACTYVAVGTAIVSWCTYKGTCVHFSTESFVYIHACINWQQTHNAVQLETLDRHGNSWGAVCELSRHRHAVSHRAVCTQERFQVSVSFCSTWPKLAPGSHSSPYSPCDWNNQQSHTWGGPRTFQAFSGLLQLAWPVLQTSGDSRCHRTRRHNWNPDDVWNNFFLLERKDRMLCKPRASGYVNQALFTPISVLRLVADRMPACWGCLVKQVQI